MESDSSVYIEKLVSGGEGLARVDGRAVFASDVVPGDTVTGRLVQASRKRTVLTDVVVHEPAEGRRKPPCRYVPECGGCRWQHIEDDLQRVWKRRIVGENIRRLGGIEIPDESIAVIWGSPFSYRSRIRLHRDGRDVGFHRRRSNAVIPVEECAVATEPLNEAIAAIREEVDRGELQHVSEITLIDSGNGVYRSDRDGTAELIVAGRVFRFASDGFAQSNRDLLEPMGRLLQDAVRPGRIIDLYAGAGLLPFLILSGAGEITSVMCVEPSNANAHYIAENLGSVAPGVVDVTVRATTAEVALQEPLDVTPPPGGTTTLLLDPPRGGLSRNARAALMGVLKEAPTLPDIVYLSCDSAALARDLAFLDSRYTIESCRILDFFPQTAHIEVLTVLRGR